MECCCGFDIYPRLEATASNKETYRQFLDEIIRTYENVYDEAAETTHGKVLGLPATSHHADKPYIRFMVGEGPYMPASPDRCDYFLRFSSEIISPWNRAAEPYIRSVCQIAKKHFGSRVHFWHEGGKTEVKRQWGYYEIRDLDRKLREVETAQEQELQNRALQGGEGETKEDLAADSKQDSSN